MHVRIDREEGAVISADNEHMVKLIGEGCKLDTERLDHFAPNPPLKVSSSETPFCPNPET